MKQLKIETLTFKLDTEEEATNLIEDYKNEANTSNFILTKSSTTYKSKKDRKTGEIIDQYWLVCITKEYEVM